MICNFINLLLSIIRVIIKLIIFKGECLMPASVTHAYFSNDVYDILPNTIKKNLSTSRMRMFGQSTDSFIFYHLFSLKSGKRLREFQGVFHTTKTREFFVSLISYIKK